MFAQQALAIFVPAIGPEGDGRIPQIAQVAHGLSIGHAAKIRLLQYRFFELRVGDTALCHSHGSASRAQEGGQ